MSSPSYRHFTDTAAQNYQRDFVPVLATPVAAGLLRLAALQPGERVLDVACGTGVVARLAAECVGPRGSVTAVDVAPDMIDVAKSLPAPAGCHIEWHRADAAALPLGDASYDAVLCQMGLMFMDDTRTALAEMRRVVAPGGRVVVTTPGAIQPPFAAMEKAIVDHLGAQLGGFVGAVFSMDDPDALAALLRDAGLREVVADVSTVALRLPPPGEFLWQYIGLTPMGPLVVDAPDDAKAATERQFADGCRDHVADDALVVEQPMVLASGRC